MKKILVTGGAGFIGSNFVNYMLRNYDVKITTVDKLTYAGKRSNLDEAEKTGRHEFIVMDINNPDIECLIKNTDAIVHFAAETHVDNSIKSADEFVKTNVNGTYNLIKYATKYNVRFHHVSTDEVYGTLDLGDNTAFNEQTPYNPRNPYAATKAASDHLVRSYIKTFGLKATISNCSNNYGPFQDEEKFLPKSITRLLEGGKIPIYGKGENVRDWLFVKDHCRAIDYILRDGKIGDTYCVGGMGRDISNLELARELIRIICPARGDEAIEFVKDRPGHDLRYAVDWSKIKRKLGWEPKYDLKTNLLSTVEWYKKRI